MEYVDPFRHYWIFIFLAKNWFTYRWWFTSCAVHITSCIIGFRHLYSCHWIGLIFFHHLRFRERNIPTSLVFSCLNVYVYLYVLRRSFEEWKKAINDLRLSRAFSCVLGKRFLSLAGRKWQQQDHTLGQSYNAQLLFYLFIRRSHGTKP